MKLEKLQFVEIAGALAVVLSLLFVAYEIRQSNRIAIATMEYEIRNNFTELNSLMMIDTEFAELRIKLRNPNSILNEIDYMKAESFAGRLFNVWNAVEEAHNNGMISENTYNTYLRDDIRWTVNSYPLMHSFWKQMSADYIDAFDSDVFTYFRESISEYEADLK